MRYWVYNAQSAGPSMVLVHGLAGSHHGFEALAAQLPGVQLIVPDVPGFGYSSLPPRRDWTVAGLARLLNQFVAALAMQSPPYLLGHSMGGLVASCMVAQRPELYQRKLVLLSPVPTPVTWRDSRWSGMLAGAVHYTIGATTGPVGAQQGADVGGNRRYATDARYTGAPRYAPAEFIPPHPGIEPAILPPAVR